MSSQNISISNKSPSTYMAEVEKQIKSGVLTLGEINDAEDLARKLVKGGCVIDVKSAFDPAVLNTAGLRVWRL